MENWSVTSGFPDKRLVIPRFDICWCQNEQFVVQPVEFSMIWKDHSSTEIFEIRCVFWMMWLDKENVTGNHSSPIALTKVFLVLCVYRRLYFRTIINHHCFREWTDIQNARSGSHFNKPQHMMTSSNGNIFRVTGHLCGEFTSSPRWIPRTKASDAELWCFLWSAYE